MKQYLDTNHDDIVSLMEIIQFFFHFITKVFLYVIFLLLIIIFSLYILYFVDLLYNINSGEGKPPLFDVYVIVSPSMVSTINVQDGIVIHREDTASLNPGDIISFLSVDPYYRGEIITHRIIGIEKNQDGEVFYRTKGDNNNVADPFLVSEHNVYGKVIFKIPKLGVIRNFLMTYVGWIFCIAIPFLYLIIKEIIRVRKLLNRKQQNLEQLEII